MTQIIHTSKSCYKDLSWKKNVFWIYTTYFPFHLSANSQRKVRNKGMSRWCPGIKCVYDYKDISLVICDYPHSQIMMVQFQLYLFKSSFELILIVENALEHWGGGREGIYMLITEVTLFRYIQTKFLFLFQNTHHRLLSRLHSLTLTIVMILTSNFFKWFECHGWV